MFIKFNSIFQVGGRRKTTSESQLEVKGTRKSLIVSKDASFYIITIVIHINTLVLWQPVARIFMVATYLISNKTSSSYKKIKHRNIYFEKFWVIFGDKKQHKRALTLIPSASTSMMNVTQQTLKIQLSKLDTHCWSRYLVNTSEVQMTQPESCTGNLK